MAFGQSLKALLDERGIKQNELAKKIGLSESTLSSMISRDVGKVDIEIFLQICDAIDCDPEQFYQDYKRKKARRELPDDERYLLELFRLLTSFEKGIIIGRIEQIVEQHKKGSHENEHPESASDDKPKVTAHIISTDGEEFTDKEVEVESETLNPSDTQKLIKLFEKNKENKA